MEDQKIKSISEAFSMQPISLVVSAQSTYDYNTNNYPKNDYIDMIKEIKKEIIVIGRKCGDPDPVEEIYYTGYNFEGKKIFQYIAKTVNIHYFG